jgi:NAD+ kinase
VATVGFLPHHDRGVAHDLARVSARWLEAEGHQARILSDEMVARRRRWGDEAGPDPAAGLDLVVSLGGDGTMLLAVDLVSAAGVPVMGVNLGHLGYLTEVDPEGLEPALRRFLSGDYLVEERMTLDVEVRRSEAGERAPAASIDKRALALNDAVIQRAPGAGHTVHIAVAVDGNAFTTYATDSLIVATPTGSTAYNLSARGPIVSPRAHVILVTPVAPHMLFDRSLVLDAGETISIEVIDGVDAEVFVDGGSVGRLGMGDSMTCVAGAHDARLVSFGGRQFHQILKQKFGLADR